ncbi:muscarinic acetylcholine receptor M1 [Engraulis encrasicolus]|uniref:muscarinic acetylcholine receptor M1 n=1 Tax=Engraulis encrasicolus TaxID=184585 RepID=UPI002FCF96B7
MTLLDEHHHPSSSSSLFSSSSSSFSSASLYMGSFSTTATSPPHHLYNHSTPSNSSTHNLTGVGLPSPHHVVFTWEMVVIVLITGPLSAVTIVGNLLVILSFRVNSHLRTVSNYFLLSLAVADLILGAVSMNFYTTYILIGQWTLGNLACDVWLAVDYVASNASVMNLLAICCDRYLSVTRPLTYRAKRTPRRAAIMIGLAWGVSFAIWAPPILFWEDMVGERKVPEGECSVQFFYVPVITFVTAIAAFYLPVTIMAVLYWRVYRETERRSQQLAGLTGTMTTATALAITSQASGQHFSQCSSSEGSSSGGDAQLQCPAAATQAELDELRGGRSGGRRRRGPAGCWSTVLHCLKRERDTMSSTTISPTQSRYLHHHHGSRRSDSLDSSNDGGDRNDDGDYQRSVQEVPLVRMGDRNSNVDGYKGGHHTTTPDPSPSMCGRISSSFSNPSSPPASSTRPYSTISHLAARTCSATKTLRKLRSSSLIRERKAARTLSAILLAFIVTWTPYNIMVLVSTFCDSCVPEQLWQLGYWLCYVNSTVNPVCYALCNQHFRVTFKELLLCRWRASRRKRRRWVRPGVG